MNLFSDEPSRPTRPILPFGLLACIFVGLPIGFNLEIIGRITGTELAVIFVIPTAFACNALPRLTWPIRQLVILSIVWLIAQIISDLINDTDLENMARGFARALTTAMLIVGFSSLIRDNIGRIIAMFVATAIGLAVGFHYQPNGDAVDEPWKFGYGTSVTMMMIAIAGILWRGRSFLFAITVCMAAAGVNLYAGFRSMAGIAFLTGVVMAASLLASLRKRQWSKSDNIFAALMLLIGSFCIMEIYAYSAQSGLLGREAQNKYLHQVGTLGVLLSGRAEIFVSSQAIMDAPIWGHGSWANDSYYADLYKEIVGLDTHHNYRDETDLIPTHSHIFGAWTEGGVFSALFWFYVIFLLAKALLRMTHDINFAHPVLAFSLLLGSWAVLFSPYGLFNRPLSCFEIVVAAVVLRQTTNTPAPGDKR